MTTSYDLNLIDAVAAVLLAADLEEKEDEKA